MEREATLDELLREPGVIALMDRDGVDPEAVRRLFFALRERLASGEGLRRVEARADARC